MGGGSRAIKAVFFDAGGTLIHPHPTVGEIYAKTALKYRARLDPLQIQLRFLKAFQAHSSVRLRGGSSESGERAFWRKVVWDTVGGKGAVRAFDDYLDELYDVMARAESWRLYPDALPTLEKFRALGVPMGLISNWDSRLLRTLQGMGLNRFFRVISISSLEGVSKPNPRIFLDAARKLGLAPAQCLHVGDTLRDDVHGAQGAGMRAFLVKRHGLTSPGDARVGNSLLDILRYF